jgi:hypothetical protein
MGHLLVLRVAPVAYPRSPQGIRPTLLRRPRNSRAGRKLNSPAGGDIVLNTSARDGTSGHSKTVRRPNCNHAAIARRECCIFWMLFDGGTRERVQFATLLSRARRRQTES